MLVTDVVWVAAKRRERLRLSDGEVEDSVLERGRGVLFEGVPIVTLSCDRHGRVIRGRRATGDRSPSGDALRGRRALGRARAARDGAGRRAGGPTGHPRAPHLLGLVQQGVILALSGPHRLADGRRRSPAAVLRGGRPGDRGPRARLGDEGSGNAEMALLREADEVAASVVRSLLDWARTDGAQMWLSPSHERPSPEGDAWLETDAGSRVWSYPFHGPKASSC